MGTKVDRLICKMMAVDSPTAQIPGGKAAKISQRVEDNAFHLEGEGEKCQTAKRLWLDNAFHLGFWSC